MIIGAVVLLTLVAGVVLLIGWLTLVMSGSEMLRQRVARAIVHRGEQGGLEFPTGIKYAWLYFQQFVTNSATPSSRQKSLRLESDLEWRHRVWLEANTLELSPAMYGIWSTQRAVDAQKAKDWLDDRLARVDRAAAPLEDAAAVAKSLDDLRSVDTQSKVAARGLALSVYTGRQAWALLLGEITRYVDAAGRGGAAGLVIAVAWKASTSQIDISALDFVAAFTVVGSVGAVGAHNAKLATSLVPMLPSARLQPRSRLTLIVASVVFVVTPLLLLGHTFMAL